jgi:hypothetical protein
MTTLFITEFTGLGRDTASLIVPAANQPATAEQTVTLSGSSTSSNALNAATTLVRLQANAVCNILMGANPTATTANMRLAADQTEYFTVTPGLGFKVAAIAGV